MSHKIMHRKHQLVTAAENKLSQVGSLVGWCRYISYSDVLQSRGDRS